MAECNTVVLSTSSYNSIKNENFKLNLFIDNLLGSAVLSEDHQSLVFESENVETALKFCFYETYKKKLSTLKTQATRYGDRTKKEVTKND